MFQFSSDCLPPGGKQTVVWRDFNSHVIFWDLGRFRQFGSWDPRIRQGNLAGLTWRCLFLPHLEYTGTLFPEFLQKYKVDDKICGVINWEHDWQNLGHTFHERVPGRGKWFIFAKFYCQRVPDGLLQSADKEGDCNREQHQTNLEFFWVIGFRGWYLCHWVSFPSASVESYCHANCEN